MVENSFSDLKSTDLVLEMPEGGFLHGQAKEYSSDNSNTVIIEYNSETDSNSVTVSEAKEKLKENSKNSFSIMPRMAMPPTKIRELNYGTSYVSSIFTGNGWRFSDVQWVATKGSGDYLRWTSLIDGGRVGSYGEAYATYTGSIQGTSLNVNTPVWNTENGQGQVYYTFNPISGTQYKVENY